jgi:Asp-tRNA(Asn)/Glu-tRNA(Gln) amidotransferase A subunit family amidase
MARPTPAAMDRPSLALQDHAVDPALAMMAGLSSSGLPLSVQFVGRNFAEATLFQVARAWEHAAGTDKKRPPIG